MKTRKFIRFGWVRKLCGFDFLVVEVVDDEIVGKFFFRNLTQLRGRLSCITCSSNDHKIMV